MQIKKFISGIIASLFLANMAIADTSTNYKIDISELNTAGTVSSSANYKTNSAVVGFVDGNMGYSAGFTLGSGLPYLELWCGNGILEFGEQCDDGNGISGDGCSSSCVPDGGGGGSICGNGVIQAGEQCDDGNLANGDGCSSACTTEGGGGGGGYPTPYSYHICGNKKVEVNEQCDDGNTISGDGCSASCNLETTHPTTPGEPPVKPGEPGQPGEKPGEVTPPAEQPTETLPGELPGIGIEREIKIKARPEKRVNPEQNWGIPGRIVFYNTTLKKTILVVNIGMNDIGWGQLDSDRLPDGVYDISFKGISHLTKVIRNIKIDSTTKTLDFTDGEEFYLVAGDVHQSKDDFINGLDISAAIDLLYTSDINGDLNRDGIVNGLDVSIVVSNIYQRGERLVI